MKVILRRGGNYETSRGNQRFEASDTAQDVPAPFGKAMLARGPEFAVEAPAGPGAAPARKPASTADLLDGDDPRLGGEEEEV